MDIVTHAPGVCAGQPPEGGNGHYSEYVHVVPNGTISGDEAQAAAAARTHEGLAGRVATVTSEAERLFVLDRSGVTPQTRVTTVWIGGRQVDNAPAVDAGWHWITGQPWEYAAWVPDQEPNDNTFPVTERGNEQYLEMYFLAEPSAWYGRWNDKAGDAIPGSYGYAVELGVVPEPSAAVIVLASGGLFLMRRRR